MCWRAIKTSRFGVWIDAVLLPRFSCFLQLYAVIFAIVCLSWFCIVPSAEWSKGGGQLERLPRTEKILGSPLVWDLYSVDIHSRASNVRSVECRPLRERRSALQLHAVVFSNQCFSPPKFHLLSNIFLHSFHSQPRKCSPATVNPTVATVTDVQFT